MAELFGSDDGSIDKAGSELISYGDNVSKTVSLGKLYVLFTLIFTLLF